MDPILSQFKSSQTFEIHLPYWSKFGILKHTAIVPETVTKYIEIKV